MKKKIYILIIVITIISLTIGFIIYPSKKTEPDDLVDNKFLSTNFNLDEINYILKNNLDLDILKQYNSYNNFKLFNYFDYEKIRIEKNFSFLESINLFNNPNYFNPYINPKEAILKETSLILVNKSFYLNKDYIPPNLISVLNYDIEYTNSDIVLRKEVLDNYLLMYQDAKKENIELVIFSGFRSFKRQEYLFYEIYNDDTISAKPGHSEHQSGFAIDISTRDIGLIDELAQTKTYKWLIENAHNYGFILRFPKNKTNITTYNFEPWHFRYVGNIATFIMENSLTLEEYIFSYLEI